MVNKRGKTQRRSLQASSEERDLWNAVTADVKPLEGRSKEIFCGRPKGNIRGAGLRQQKKVKQRYNLDTNKVGELRHGLAPGLDRRTQTRLRRGKVNIEARLDLHGLDKVAAFGALHRFLEHAYTGGKKTVLVITGKGLRKSGEVGALRQAVPQWLNTEKVRRWVHAFDHASPRDGGEGALYIVMRRSPR